MMVDQFKAELAELKQQINAATEKAKELEDKISYMTMAAVSEDKYNKNTKGGSDLLPPFLLIQKG